MSTFDGFVSEFPLIRIDRFRTLPDRPQPLACFLSHVHSDHLLGLESLKSPFVYCSAATRELLLRLERYPHHINFARGILERRLKTYKHLRKLLKPLPLDTPVTIELCPGADIQVTLFDANHCLGSVMFLIEGQGKAVLYTGDVRAEPWWVNSLVRKPTILPYATGKRRLDKIYLDTTFATKADPYKSFPSKAQGIDELLGKVLEYPQTTVFHLRAWTFGYEEVWLALSNALRSRVHLDSYRYNLYTAVANPAVPSLVCRESPVLAGFTLANTHHPGILTRDPDARIHSCENGLAECPSLRGHRHVIDITPIVTRYADSTVPELGAGGGNHDLDPSHELELPNADAMQHVLALCEEAADRSEGENANALRKVAERVRSTAAVGQTALALNHAVPLLDALRDPAAAEGADANAIPLAQLPHMLVGAGSAHSKTHSAPGGGDASSAAGLRPASITFPYARHSSFGELRGLVAALRPCDVWPCTVPPVHEWHEDMSMEALFGDVCGGVEAGFAYDVEMRRLRRMQPEEPSGLTALGKRNRGGCVGEELAVSQGTTVDEDETDGEDGDLGRNGGADGLPSEDVHAEEDGDEDRCLDGREIEDASLEGRPVKFARLNDMGCRVMNGGMLSSPLGSTQMARLRARQEAFAAAETGSWHTIQLESTMSAEDDDELL